MLVKLTRFVVVPLFAVFLTNRFLRQVLPGWLPAEYSEYFTAPFADFFASVSLVSVVPLLWGVITAHETRRFLAWAMPYFVAVFFILDPSLVDWKLSLIYALMLGVVAAAYSLLLQSAYRGLSKRESEEELAALRDEVYNPYTGAHFWVPERDTSGFLPFLGVLGTSFWLALLITVIIYRFFPISLWRAGGIGLVVLGGAVLLAMFVNHLGEQMARIGVVERRLENR